MSASQEKKKRQELRAEGVEKKQVQKNRTLKAKKREKMIKTAITTFIAIIILLMVVFNSTLFYTGITAVKIGDWGYKTAEYNFFYNDILYRLYNQYYQTYGQYVSIVFDPTKLDEQKSPDGRTWDEYIEEQAMENMQKIAMLNTAAEKEGFVLDAEAQEQITNIITDNKAAATQNNLSFSKFLVAQYGKGMSEKLLNKLVRLQVTADRYQRKLLNDLSYTDEELDARYAESASDYNLITFYKYFVNGSANEAEGLDDEAAMNAAFQIANRIKTGKTEEVFGNLVLENVPEDQKEIYSDLDYTRQENISPSSISSEYREWLTSPDRKYGDTEVIESDTGYYVLLYIESNDNSYNLQGFRHILVRAEPDPETQEITANAVLTAQVKAQEIYDLWKADPTEENFIAMANEKSDDPGSNTNGGLYEGVVLGQMVPEIEDWLFSSARKPGDTELIYVKSTNYTGYHIMYYTGSGERQDRKIARELLEQEWLKEWFDSQADAFPIDTTIAFWFAE